MKHKYHWIKFDRDAPDEGFQDHRVLKVLFDGHREANVALIGHLDKLQYIIATENMKPGDLIRTSKHIPKNPGKPIIINTILIDKHPFLFLNSFSYRQCVQMKVTLIHWVHYQLEHM